MVFSVQVTSLLERIERQKRERELLEKQFSTHHPDNPGHTSSGHTPSDHTHYVIETAKRRKIATAPLPKSYTGFTSSSSEPLTSKPKTRPLSQTTPIETRPLTESVTEKKTWAAPKPVITPSSWRLGQELARKALEREVKETNEEERGKKRQPYPTASNVHEILKDLEMSEEEDEEEPVRATNPVKQVIKLSGKKLAFYLILLLLFLYRDRETSGSVTETV